MKLVFAGTPEFARSALEALVGAGHQIVLTMTQPDRPSGRGLQLRASPVKEFALAHAISVIQPRGLRLNGKFSADAHEAHALLRATPHDAMIVAAYGLILPQSLLDIAPLGCLNIHASLLPRWRGAAPVQRAIEAGDNETGITIMQMDAGLDTGAVLLKRAITIDPDDTGGSLTQKLAVLGGATIVDALERGARGMLTASTQHADGDASAVTYAAKLTRDESALDFTRGARLLADTIRAFDPWPGCTATTLAGNADAPTSYKVWRATPVLHGGPAGESSAPGTIVGCIAHPSRSEAALLVATGDGILAIAELQKPGGKRLPAAAFFPEFQARSVVRFDPHARP